MAVIHLGRTLLPGSSDLPESITERTAPPLLFGLAPRGVCPAGRITPSAVRSYRTISPLPGFHPAVYFLWHFPSDRKVRPAVSRHAALWRPDFPLPSPGATARVYSLTHIIAVSCTFGRYVCEGLRALRWLLYSGNPNLGTNLLKVF